MEDRPWPWASEAWPTTTRRPTATLTQLRRRIRILQPRLARAAIAATTEHGAPESGTPNMSNTVPSFRRCTRHNSIQFCYCAGFNAARRSVKRYHRFALRTTFEDYAVVCCTHADTKTPDSQNPWRIGWAVLCGRVVVCGWVNLCLVVCSCVCGQALRQVAARRDSASRGYCRISPSTPSGGRTEGAPI